MSDPVAGGASSYAMISDIAFADQMLSLPLPVTELYKELSRRNYPHRFKFLKAMKTGLLLEFVKKRSQQRIGILLSILLKRNNVISEENETSEPDITTRSIIKKLISL